MNEDEVVLVFMIAMATLEVLTERGIPTQGLTVGDVAEALMEAEAVQPVSLGDRLAPH